MKSEGVYVVCVWVHCLDTTNLRWKKNLRQKQREFEFDFLDEIIFWPNDLMF
jgi:hypothetical protein